jgi:putative membrane protein
MEQTDLIEAILNFAIYFGLSIVFLVLFKYVYTLITPHDEWQLIKNQQNISAAIGFGGAIIGFAIAVAGAATNSVSVLDFITWTIIALVAQSLAFAILRFGFMPYIVQRIEQNEISAGVMLCAVNISIGLLNAACMSY